jgi:hypothetical protein
MHTDEKPSDNGRRNNERRQGGEHEAAPSGRTFDWTLTAVRSPRVSSHRRLSRFERSTLCIMQRRFVSSPAPYRRGRRKEWNGALPDVPLNEQAY